MIYRASTVLDQGTLGLPRRVKPLPALYNWAFHVRRWQDVTGLRSPDPRGNRSATRGFGHASFYLPVSPCAPPQGLRTDCRQLSGLAAFFLYALHRICGELNQGPRSPDPKGQSVAIITPISGCPTRIVLAVLLFLPFASRPT